MFTPMQFAPWVYPTLEVVHLVGIAMLLGNLMLIEARVFGFGATLPATNLVRLGLWLVAIGFGLAALSGTLMFGTQPAELLANRAFLIKMLLMFAASCNATMFHTRESLVRLDRTARLQMLLSTLLWIGVVASGRWIAYL